jgi:hypothetical protein
MTKAEFIRRKQVFEKRDSRFNKMLMLVLFGGMFVLYTVVHWMPQFDGWIGAGAVLALSFGCLGASYFFNGGMNQAKQEGLVCGACGGGLLGAQGEYAISTGKCGHCGQSPFSEPPPIAS